MGSLRKNGEKFRVSRIEALSDGVFAIVMTLLILELAIEGKSSVNSNGEFWLELKNILPSLLSYFMSFMILGIYWVGHHNQLIYFKSLDRYALWINILFLSFISLIPFITSLLSKYEDINAPIILYCANLVAIGLILLANWRYAFAKDLVIDTVDKRASKKIQRIILIGPLVYLIALGLSYISPMVSVVSIFLMQGFYILHKGYDKKLIVDENNI